MNEQIKAIRAEIERRKKENMYDELPMTIGRYYEDRDLLSFIDSLPEEPAPKGYDEVYLNECIAKASKTWKGVDVDKYMDEVRGNRPKLSDNLEEAAGNWAESHYKDSVSQQVCADDFIAGAKWQAEQEKDEWLKDRDGCFWDGVEEGKKAMMEQSQTKEGEVIEDGEFIKFSDGTYIDLCPDLSKESFDFKMGDKVIVQIRKV